MEYNFPKRRRKLIRLKGFDYSSDNCYFITICTRNKECLFGNIVNQKMVLNDAGIIAKKYWLDIPFHYPDVILDKYVVMPNHVHGILVIDKKIIGPVGVQNSEPLHRYQKIIPRSIGAIVRGYKLGVTKWFRQNTDCHVVWQRLYYDHIIRNERSLNIIRNYIKNNPKNWLSDRNNILFNRSDLVHVIEQKK
ncbi:MAG: hypothetical protein PHN19_02965 [Patescibacteria group bacterium]|nr:hypothetical protein [Patescibacteria group bacterium]